MNQPKDFKFSIGKLVITANASNVLAPDCLPGALYAHGTGDWGKVCPEDWQANDDALKTGLRLLSAYDDANGVRFWIITEADRSVTTILLPEDY